MGATIEDLDWENHGRTQSREFFPKIWTQSADHHTGRGF